MNYLSTLFQRAFPYLKSFLLPFLAAIYPAIFHYANNSTVASFSSLAKLVSLLAGIAIIVYVLFCTIFRGRVPQAANASLIFFLFFHTYGLLFNTLYDWDWFRVEHYSLLPSFILLGLYIAWFINRIDEKTTKRLWTGATIIIATLIAFNIIRIVPVQMHRSFTPNNQPAVPLAKSTQTTGENYPDIYYVVFDEMAGFDVVRQYWQYKRIDEFVDFLESKGFYVAPNSRAKFPCTLYEMASRLNYEYLPYPSSYSSECNSEVYMEKMANNRALWFLKSIGYNTIAYDEHRTLAYRAAPPLAVDHLFERSPYQINKADGVFDSFSMMVLRTSVLQPLTMQPILYLPALKQHENMIFYTVKEAASQGFPSPKFVYIHLMIPHFPFMFDANGNYINPLQHYDWDKYLGNYIYSIHLARELINNIMAVYYNKPVVIILQSDHGARNLQVADTKVLLKNYPEENQLHIVNALYLPGCEDAPLSQDMDPINTFPIVFNCYFDTNIPLK